MDDIELTEEPELIQTPEKNLWCCVLLDAVQLARRGSKGACSWIYCSSQFQYLCTELGLNADSVRERVVPEWFAKWLEEERQREVLARTDKPSHRDSYYYRKRKQRELAAQGIVEETTPVELDAAVDLSDI